MDFEPLFAAAAASDDANGKGPLDPVPVLVAAVPSFCDGCAIEFFGSELPAEEAAVWSPFQKLVESAEPVHFAPAEWEQGGGGEEPGTFQRAPSPTPTPTPPLTPPPSARVRHMSPEDTHVLRSFGVRSAIGVPLHLEGRVVGSLSAFTTTSGRVLGDAHLAAFLELGRRLEARLDEAWLSGIRPLKVARGEDLSLLARRNTDGELDQWLSEPELNERRRQQRAVSELAGLAIREPRLRAVLKEACRRVSEVLEMPFVKILEYLPADEVLVVRAVSGFAQDHVDRTRVPAGGASQAGFTFEARHTIRVSDFRKETRFEIPDIPGYSLRSGMSVVIEGVGQPWGVLEADVQEPRVYTDAEAAFMKTVSDILGQAVERSASEMQLRYQATLLDTVGDAVVAMDPQWQVAYWNRGAERMFGWRAEEAIGQNALELLVPAPERPGTLEGLRGVLEGDEWFGEMHLLRSDGTSLPVLSSGSAVRDEEGRITGTVVVSTDITERLHLEEQLRQSQKMEAMGRLAGGVAHDFNNLLTSITGNTELLLRELVDDPSARELAEEIQGAATRAVSVTGQLLAFSRNQALLPQIINPKQVVEAMEGLLRRVIGEHIELVLESRGRPTRILADPTRIEQVIMNLAVNARDAMPLGGTLTISVEERRLERPLALGQGELPPGRYAVLSVRDTGSGIPPEVQGRVFEPFFTTKAKGEGTGLGLSTVYGIVQQSGGGVLLDSRPGVGTSFSVFFPEIEKTPAEEPAVAERREAPAETGRGSGAAGTILVAEDDPSVRTLLMRLLPRVGYRVLEAADGARALELIREHGDELQLVVTDVIMPTMSGPELASELEREGLAVPVLFMSGYTDDMLERQDVLGRGIPLLQKPFTMEQLLRAVREAMGSSPAMDGPVE